MLAEILRSAAVKSRTNGKGDPPAVRDIFARLAEDRFNVVVAGRFNRGKTSLMNALLSTSRLPVGSLPLTSVITTVSYGSSEIATIDYRDRSIPDRVPLDELENYVTERGNPGNVRKITTARIQLPADLLRRGLHFVDTPGVGSPILENSRTTHAFLPEADAVLLVTSYESPLSEDEMRIVQLVRSYGRRLFFIVNKADLVDPDEREKVGDYVRTVLGGIGIVNPDVFSVVAREGRLDGIDDLASHLTRFLLEHKQSEFIVAMCDRVADVLDALPDTEQEQRNLRALAAALHDGPVTERAISSNGRCEARFSRCVVCERASSAVVAFLCTYQYELVASRTERDALAESGFCPAHAWQYHTLAGPRGTCITLSTMLSRLAERLDSTATSGELDLAALAAILDQEDACPSCRVRAEAERDAVAQAVRTFRDGAVQEQTYCIAHFRALVMKMRDVEGVRSIARKQAEAMTAIAEDMRRFVLKFDATRRYLMDDEERDADRRGLELLAGSRSLNAMTHDR